MSIDSEATTTSIPLRAKGPVVGERAVTAAQATAMTSPQPDPDVASATATSNIDDKPPQGDLTAGEGRAEEERAEVEIANTNSDNKEQDIVTTSDIPSAPEAPEGAQIDLEQNAAPNPDSAPEGMRELEPNAAPIPESTSAPQENRNGESAELNNSTMIEEGLSDIQEALAAANVADASVPQVRPFEMPPVTMEEIIAANQLDVSLMEMAIPMGFGLQYDMPPGLMQAQNLMNDMNGALPQAPHLDPSPEINGYVRDHMSQQQDMHDEQYADHDAPRVQAYAKLQFEDGEYYMNSQSLILGRDEDGYKAALRRERRALREAQRPKTPVRSTRGTSRLSEDIKSVFSGFGETGEQEREGRRRRKKASKKSKSESSSQRDAISSAGLGLQHPYMATYPPGYFDNVTDPTSIRPSNDCPFVGIHPHADQSVAKYKALSRNHLKISFNSDKEQFEATFLGRNGGFCRDVGVHQEVYCAEGTKVPLQNGTVLQIAAVVITFILPDAPVADGMHDFPSDDEDRARSDLIYSEGGKEMSFDFAAEGREGAGSDSSEDEHPIFTPEGYDSEDDEHRSSDDERSVINGTGAVEDEEDEDEAEEDPEGQPEEPKEEEQPAPVKKSIERKDKSKLKSKTKSSSKKLNLKIKTKDKSQGQNKSKAMSKTKEIPPTIKQEKPDESPTLTKKRGPGRPPKDGIMSKREQRLAKKAALELEESQKAGKLEEASESPAPGKNKVGRPRKYPKPDGEEEPKEKRKYTKRKPKELKEGEVEAEGSGDNGPAKEKKEKKPPKPARSPTPQFDIANLPPEQLEKPPQNYVLLIYEALTNSTTGQLSLPQIYRAIQRKYPYFTLPTTTNGWQSSVRHNLGQNDAFKKCERDGKGWTWAIVEGVPIEKERKKKPSPPPFQGAQPHQPIQANYPPHMMQQQPYYPGMGPPPPGYPPNFQPHPNFQPQHGQPPPYMGQHPQHPQHHMQMNGVPPQHMQMNGSHMAPPPFLAAGIASQLAAPKPGSYSSPYAPKAAPPATPQEIQQAPANAQKPAPPQPQPQPSEPSQPSQPSQPLPSKAPSASPAPLENGPAPPPTLGDPQQPNIPPQPPTAPRPPSENEHILNMIDKFKHQLRPHLEKTLGSTEKAEAVLTCAANQVLGKSNESTGESQEAAIVDTIRRTLAGSNISNIQRSVVQGSPQPLANQNETQSTASQQPANPAGSERPPVITRPAFLGRPTGTPIPRPPMTAPTMKRADSGSPANAAPRPSAPSLDSPAPTPTPNSTNGANTPKLNATEIVQTESVPLVGQKRQRSEEENDDDMRELKRMAPSGPPQLKA